VAAVLLTDEHHERHAVDPRRSQRADGVAETCGRVQDDEGRLVQRRRPPSRDADDRALVEREHEVDVVGQVGQERHLGGPGIGEDRGQAVATQDVERRVADGAGSLAHPAVVLSTAAGSGVRATSATETAPIAATAAKM
jgi:hypothetical protein